jgi:hypothetical protein
MTKHLNTQGRPNLKGKFLLFLVSKQNLNPSSWHIWHINNHWKWIRNEKIITPQIKGVKNSKKQITKHYKANFQTPKKFLVCCSIAISVATLALDSRPRQGVARLRAKRRKPRRQAACSRECKTMWGNRPSNSQGNSHIGS